MTVGLPGDDAAAKIVGITKAALRLIGGSDLADAIADLIGIERVRVEAFVAQAERELASHRAAEFRDVSAPDREWAHEILTRAYRKLASQPDDRLVRESLVGPGAISALIIDGLDNKDRADLQEMPRDGTSYFNGLSQSIAHLVASWFRSNPVANRVAVSFALGETLSTLRSVLLTVDALESRLAPSSRPHWSVLWGSVRAAAAAEIARPPEYFPPGFDNQELGEGLNVVSLDEVRFARFSGRGLYWDETLSGERISVSASDFAAGELSILLGNPGSGKSTLARALVLDRLRSDKMALYCRLEDLAQLARTHADASAATLAIMAFARAARQVSTWSDCESIASGIQADASRPLVVLDGLDELVSAPEFADARRLAETLAADGYAVVVTSRISGYTQPWEAARKHLAIVPLDAAAQERFVTKWFAEPDHDGAHARFRLAQRQGTLDGAFQSPLTLGFACLLAGLGEVPMNRGDLFDRFIDHFLRAPWRHPEQQELDVARVGELKRAARTVAWAMASTRTQDDVTWADAAALSELADELESAAGYSIFAAGLLIPHGPVEPIGATQQTVRWLHRAVQENLVAQRLRTQIRQGTAGWRDTILRAALLPTWAGTLDQLLALIDDGPELHELMGTFTNVLRTGDTPDAAISSILAQATGKACTCPTRRREVANALAERGEWRLAYRADPVTAIEQLRDDVESRRAVTIGYDWLTVYGSSEASAGELIDFAWQSGLQDPYLCAVATWRSLARNPDADLDLHLNPLIAERLGWHSLVPLPEDQRWRVAGWVNRRLFDESQATRLDGSVEHLSWGDAYLLVETAFGQADMPSAEAFSGHLRLAAEFAATNRNRTHDFVALRPYIDGRTFSGFEAGIIGAHLELSGAWAADFDEGAKGMGRLDLRYCCDPEGWNESFHLTALSQQLAIEIVRLHADGNLPGTLSQIESAQWALLVLERQPSVEVCRPMYQMRRRITESRGLAHMYMDPSLATRALNAQPWFEAGLEVLGSPSADRTWDGLCLIWAAVMKAESAIDPDSVDDEAVRELFEAGVDRFFSPETTPSDMWDFELPDRVPTRLLKHLATVAIERTSQLGPEATWHALRTVERAVLPAGLLPNFFNRLAVRPSL
ncbi:NACHT domain-containing protein [Microbacterium sp. AZCO]|uniref:NACHT domain-containing protein n=1 Tax=Microbacterium sp. AZCO TaxID=3142976 RepID=UPI0031F3559F